MAGWGRVAGPAPKGLPQRLEYWVPPCQEGMKAPPGLGFVVGVKPQHMKVPMPKLLSEAGVVGSWKLCRWPDQQLELQWWSESPVCAEFGGGLIGRNGSQFL